jgi:transposase
VTDSLLAFATSIAVSVKSILEFLHAEFHDNMRYESFIRCILRCFESLSGVPWVLVFDNTRTVVEGRNEDGKKIFNPKERQFGMVICGDKPACREIGFHLFALLRASSEVCALYSPNQKGTVENGVAKVSGNFLAGFILDDDDLKVQLNNWLLERKNKKCQAHFGTPNELLAEERKAFEPLREKVDYYI